MGNTMIPAMFNNGKIRIIKHQNNIGSTIPWESFPYIVLIQL
jgi:hypothetical protein